jgi:hypothetical protein
MSKIDEEASGGAPASAVEQADASSSCLHCDLWRAIDRYVEAHGKRDPASGKTIIDVHAVMLAFGSVVGDMLSHVDDEDYRMEAVHVLMTTAESIVNDDRRDVATRASQRH